MNISESYFDSTRKNITHNETSKADRWNYCVEASQTQRREEPCYIFIYRFCAHLIVKYLIPCLIIVYQTACIFIVFCKMNKTIVKNERQPSATSISVSEVLPTTRDSCSNDNLTENDQNTDFILSQACFCDSKCI